LFDSPQKRLISAALSAILLSSCLIFAPASRFMLTVGLTMLYLGFGLVLVLSLRTYDVFPQALAKPFSLVGSSLAYVGMYSYSVYLWHLPVESWGLSFLGRILHVQVGRTVGLLLYMTAAIVFGIFLSRLIEYPVLRLRDRVFPAMQGGAVRSAASDEECPALGSAKRGRE
jgi:peptidoglycan/LPS O-acetylase OafA/YrhL